MGIETPSTVKVRLKEKILRIVKKEPHGRIEEPDLKKKLGFRGSKRPSSTYYDASRELVEEGKLGLSTTISKRKSKGKGGEYTRELAVKVYSYIEPGRGKINEIFNDLGYDAKERKFTKEPEYLNASWISARVRKLSKILIDHAPSPELIDFVKDALGEKAFSDVSGTLADCISNAVRFASENNVVPFLDEMKKRENIEWLKKVVNSGLIGSAEGAWLFKLLEHPYAVDLYLEAIDEDTLLEEETSMSAEGFGHHFAKILESFPEKKKEVKRKLSGILKEEKKGKSFRLSVVESALEEI